MSQVPTFDLHEALIEALPGHQIEIRGWFDTEENVQRWYGTVGRLHIPTRYVQVGIGTAAKPMHTRIDALRALLAALTEASLTRDEHQAIDRVCVDLNNSDFHQQTEPTALTPEAPAPSPKEG